MDDHFWPSVYPGLIVGGLVGLAAGGILAAVIGGLGGLAGAFAAYYAVTFFGVPQGIIALAAIILGSAAGAKLVIVLCTRLGLSLARGTARP